MTQYPVRLDVGPQVAMAEQYRSNGSSQSLGRRTILAAHYLPRLVSLLSMRRPRLSKPRSKFSWLT